MFGSNKAKYRNDSFSKHRAGKATSKKNRSFRDSASLRHLEKASQVSPVVGQGIPVSPNLASAIITICVGREQRLFAAHEDVLCQSPYLQEACRTQFLVDSTAKRIDLPADQPEVFSSVLEFLYKGDYTPRLAYDKKRGNYRLEDASVSGVDPRTMAEMTVNANGVNVSILKDTVIYCTADRYGLEDLKRLALRKQGLQSGIQCATILTSARYAYAHTPDTDSKLRAHYLALIIRSRNTFKRSGTMQMEMEAGGRLFFDLFVAMVNHMDDMNSARSPY